MASAWQLLLGLEAWHVTQIPRRPARPQPGGPEDEGDLLAGQRAAALGAAYHRDAGPVGFGWVRDRAGGPVQVLAAGRALVAGPAPANERAPADGRAPVSERAPVAEPAPANERAPADGPAPANERAPADGPAPAAASDGRVTLKLPAGGRGETIGVGGLPRVLAPFPCWGRVAGVADSLLAAAELRPADPATAVRPSLEDGLLAVWPGAFAWLVLAEPVSRAELEELTSRLHGAQNNARKFDTPQAQLTVRRLADRHAELRQAAAAGLWRVHLLAGAMDGPDAAEVASLLCASADLAGLPYGLVPAREYGSLEAILDGRVAGRAGTGSTGHVAGRGGTGSTGHVAGRAGTGSTGHVAGRAGTGSTGHVAGRGGTGSTGQEPWRPAPRRGGEEDGQPEPASPFLGSSAVLAALARPPAREIPGRARFVLRPEFDTVPETAADGAAAAGQPGIRLGEVLDRNRMPAGPLMLPRESLNRHTFVSGATGAGKSQTVRALLEQATAAGIRWLVIEPAKAEYSGGMAARLPGVEVIRIRPGEAGQAAAGINPLEPAVWTDGTRFPLQTHADLTKSLFLAAFEAEEPFPQVLADALTRVYAGHGWDLVLGEPVTPGTRPAYPALEDLQAAADLAVRAAAYGPEVERNVRGFITVRLGSLRLGTPGRFFEGGHRLDFAALLDRNVVLEIEDVGDDQDKAFLIGAVLIQLAEHLRLRQRHRPGGRPGLRHLTVLEEAHRLLRDPGPGQRGGAAKAVELFAALLAEVRAYGEGLVVAEQIPSKLIADVIKNTAVKIVHRLPAADDRQAVGATMNLTGAQDQYLVTLPPGEAAVFADGADYPWLVRMPDGTGREATATATAGPDAIITSRSASCGPDCRAAPCTLRQMRRAQRAAEADPRITVWAELAVLGHLTGWAMPFPGLELAAALRAMDPRQAGCALAHAVDAAVAARTPAISSRVSPAALAAHVTAAMRHGLAEGTWLCDREEPQYLAPPYRWVLVFEALQAANRDGRDGRHPRSAGWEQAYGRDIPGASCARQLDAVTRWHQDAQRDTGLISAVAWGLRPDTAIERAVGARASDPDWTGRLTCQLDVFCQPCRWPLDHLKPGRQEAPPSVPLKSS